MWINVKLLTFTPTSKLSTIILDIQLNDPLITPDKSNIYLSIATDKDVPLANWNSCKRLCRTNRILSKLWHYALIEPISSIHYSFVQSYITCSQFWSTTSQKNIMKIFFSQKKTQKNKNKNKNKTKQNATFNFFWLARTYYSNLQNLQNSKTS